MTLHLLYGPQNENEMAPQRWDRMTDVWARCVVGLLLVVLSSDWFWCGQVEMSRECAFQGGHSPALCTLMAAPRAQPHSHSFGFPCSGTLICALPFAAACRFAPSFSWWHVDPCSPFMAALLQPLKFTAGLAFPGWDGIGRVNSGTGVLLTWGVTSWGGGPIGPLRCVQRRATCDDEWHGHDDRQNALC